MILPRYHIGPSLIAGAGQGLFLDEPVARGRLITAPDAIPRVYTFDEINLLPDAENLLPATVRWFEDRYTVTPEWPDECFINHAFAPSGLWQPDCARPARQRLSHQHFALDAGARSC